MPKNILEKNFLLNKRYRIYGCLGQGGFGITYRAEDELRNQAVAIKEYYPQASVSRDASGSVIVSRDARDKELFEGGLKRFLQEARILASLFEIPGIVKVLNYFEENQTAYIVMEYVKGISLRAWLERQDREFSFDETLCMLAPVMDALEKIHKKNLIHRDITPDNIMVEETGSLKLLDFGSTREYFAGQDRSRTMTVLVKYGYAPPEQYERHGKQGPWTDVYSLCATMYEIMTGCTPQNALEREEEDRLYTVSSFGIQITPRQEEVFMKKGLALNSKERYQSVRKMREDFFAKEEPEPREKSGHKKTACALLLLFLIAAGAAGAAVYLRARPDGEPAGLAGNYARGSGEYTEFLDFVRERAVSVQTEGDATIYTLDEPSVLEWGQKSNLFFMEFTKDELLDSLSRNGYSFEVKKSGEDLYVREEPYGVITTNFTRWDVLSLPDEVELQVVYDLFEGGITRVYVLAPASEPQAVSSCLADVIPFFTDSLEGSHDERIRKIEDSFLSWKQETAENGPEILSGFTYPEISVYFLASDSREGATILSAAADTFSREAPPYYWP